ncbi:hypothetical protein KVR01_005702 [Diaporthe batatas]|uniref:uncharacterized protein n=1 Tax=Diaporthe batatas TaxID=748121 RepID=UPI001D04F7E1|nr:uncharacterized protein KVR01_005702 [Diaporthe batatas]KAG8165427.1 hypothetical protein KVR01_005702 [Diaporthe batatas]
MAANAEVDANAYTAPFMLTKSLHRDVYPAVDPVNNPSVRADGKVVIVTGASGGLGFAVAKSFLQAGAKGVVLVARTAEKLEAVTEDLADHSRVLTISGNVASQEDADKVFKEAVERFGQVDVLVNAAGAMNVAPIDQISSSAWWENFEVNVRGTFNAIQALVKTTGGKGTIINLVSLGASFVAPAMSGYSASKLAVIKLGECLDVEQPGLRVFSIHPGMVEAEKGRGMVVPPFLPFSKDKAALTGGLSVYLSTEKADFLKGGYIHANWDVEELEKHQEEIAEKKLIKLAFLNGQLQPGGYPWGTA